MGGERRGASTCSTDAPRRDGGDGEMEDVAPDC